MKALHQYRQIFAILTPPKKVLLLLAVLLLIENAVALVIPWLAGQFTKLLLDRPTVPPPFSYQQILLVWFVLLTVQGLFVYLNRSLAGATTERMLARLRTRLYDHLQSLPLAFYHGRKQGEILSLLSNDAAILSSFLTVSLVPLVPHIVIALSSLGCILLISPQIAALAGLLIPIFYLTTKILGRGIRPLTRQYITQYADTFSIAQENLTTLPIIKSFTREDVESRRFQDSNTELARLSARYLQHQARLTPLVKLISMAIILFILWIVSDDIASGQLRTGDIVSLILYGMLLTQPVSRLADMYGQTQRALTAAERLVSVFSAEAEQYAGGKPLPPVRGEIRFAGVAFSYPGNTELFTHLDFTINAGETVAITGANGAGKSTIAHLLMRFAAPDKGAISIDGHDIADVRLDSLRSQIGLVQQQVLLVNSSVMDNILFGRYQADDASVIRAARASHALSFIEALPHGFDTLIGDQGVKLSGGQKQRLSLARALIKDPAILILDEATAMFDPEGEESFVKDNRELFANRTVILITHRPASLELADRILHLENGRLTPLEPIR
jgi:ABC-type multidrug transport system fused ATPase/permease subunit